MSSSKVAELKSSQERRNDSTSEDVHQELAPRKTSREGVPITHQQTSGMNQQDDQSRVAPRTTNNCPAGEDPRSGSTSKIGTNDSARVAANAKAEDVFERNEVAKESKGLIAVLGPSENRTSTMRDNKITDSSSGYIGAVNDVVLAQSIVANVWKP